MAKKNNPTPGVERHVSIKSGVQSATSSYDRRLMRRNMATGRSVDVTHETAQPSRRRPGK
ncbi:MAG: hypothetical protein KAX77_01810 [Xanthomonadales bacterium]|nr:hypothetical protein [Xanthomonadales bacterium]